MTQQKFSRRLRKKRPLEDIVQYVLKEVEPELDN